MRVMRYKESRLDECAELWWKLYEDLPYVHRPDGGKRDISADLKQLRKLLSEDGAAVVYFDAITWRWYYPKEDELVAALAVPMRRERFSDGSVYRLAPAAGPNPADP